MTRRRRSRAKFWLVGAATFTIVFAVVLVGVQFFTKTGLFKVPGVVYYDDSLNPDELAKLQTIFTDDLTLDQDLAISAAEYFEKPNLAENEYISSITVAVTDFYSADTNLAVESPDLLTTDTFQPEVDYELIPVGDLDFSRKLLAINGHYYLDNFNDGAVFRVIKFDSENFTNEIKPLVDETFNQTWPDTSSVLTFAQTGVTALSRGMNEKLAEVNDPKFFSAEIGDFLSGFDLTHTSNESSFSENATSENICSDPRSIDTLLDIGLDIVELTGNHNQDCGDEAAAATIDIYAENNIQTVGGGKTAEEAAKPLELDAKNTKITMLAYNLSTGGATTDDTPGANQYEETKVAADITTAKEKGDFVIVDVQYYECSAYASEYEDPTCDYANSAAGDQVGLFRHLIDLGADIVVGTSAHQPQTFELYNGGAIYYGLGNLFFDQSWWPGTTRSLVLAHYFYNGKLLQTRIIPTVYDGAYQTKLMEAPEWFINRLRLVSPSK